MLWANFALIRDSLALTLTVCFFASPAKVTHFPAFKTAHLVRRDKHAIVRTFVIEIKMGGWGDIRIDKYLNLSPKRHDMGKGLIFEA